ncbi:MAG: CSLREA domain-containing protein [Actinomycetota bacterium]|nr:CSLREA domain-containing protein [Actinomycetota bacterium]
MRTRTGVALAATVALAAVANAHAATFTVTRLDDPAPGACDSDCSLREAVRAANAGSGGDTIELPAGRFRLTLGGAGEDAAATGDLDLAKSVTITGAGARLTTIDAASTDRVFDVQTGVTVLIADVTITGGFVNGDGGGIESAGVLTLVRDAVSGNEALLSSNASGGGIDSSSTLTLTDTTVSGNRAYNGGGIDFGGTLTLSNSTVSGNVAGGPGSNGDGGGISGSAGATVTAENSTIAHNVSFNGLGSGGGISAAFATLRNSIVAANLSHLPNQSSTDLDNCSVGTLTSQGHNLSDGTDCGLAATGDLQSADPRLSGLGDHGGPTDTEALFQGSAAIDAGAGCGVLDQRGTPRPRGSACEIGAYELAPPLVTTTPALGIGLTSASLRGTISPSSQGTGYFFEYGATTAYGSTTQALFLPPAGSTQIVVSALVANLKQGTTYHFRLVAYNGDGTARGADATFTTNDRTKPVLTLLKVAPGIFRAAKGTKISFNLSEPATVTFKVDRVLPGVRRGGRCVARTARARGKACTRYVPVKGTLVQAGSAGANSVGFDAKVGGKTLRPGAYRLAASPRDPGQNVGKTVVTAFRIVR